MNKYLKYALYALVIIILTMSAVYQCSVPGGKTISVPSGNNGYVHPLLFY